jgi:Flp pilus assembly protein TadD
MLVDAMNPMKLAEAKGILEQLPKPVSGDRKIARSLNERGLESFNKENYLDAIEFFKQAIASDSADVEVRNNYVYALAKAMKTADAEREAGILLTYAPGRSSGWANLGEIYASKGHATLASSALIVAFQFSSNKDKTLTYLKEKSAAVDNPVFAESAQIALIKLANQ